MYNLLKLLRDTDDSIILSRSDVYLEVLTTPDTAAMLIAAGFDVIALGDYVHAITLPCTVVHTVAECGIKDLKISSPVSAAEFTACDAMRRKLNTRNAESLIKLFA